MKISITYQISICKDIKEIRLKQVNCIYYYDKLDINFMKRYNAAPLPFMGQKRKFAKPFAELLGKLPNEAVFIDFFGGSGLLSHIAKREKPNAKVIYNDFDNYCQRLAHIPHTNALLVGIRALVADIPRNAKIPNEIREKILQLIREADATVGVDYVALSSSILFSGRYALSLEMMEKQTMYNKVASVDYNDVGYLDGLTITRKDYHELFNEYRDNPNAVFILDPPYLSTEVLPYQMCWRLTDYLEVLEMLHGHKYVFFTSNKSQLLELCQWMEKQAGNFNPFANASIHKINAPLNYSSGYLDIMVTNAISA